MPIPRIKSNRKRYHFGIKFNENGWYKNQEMMGHTWAAETLNSLEKVLNTYCKTKLQKFVIESVYGTPEEMRSQDQDWTFFCNHVSKKDIANLQYVLRRVDKCKTERNMYSLLRDLDRKSCMLKDRLTWVIEHLSYKYDMERYLNGYVQAFGFYGMTPDEATERFHSYHLNLFNERLS